MGSPEMRLGFGCLKVSIKLYSLLPETLSPEKAIWKIGSYQWQLWYLIKHSIWFKVLVVFFFSSKSEWTKSTPKKYTNTFFRRSLTVRISMILHFTLTTGIAEAWDLTKLFLNPASVKSNKPLAFVGFVVSFLFWFIWMFRKLVRRPFRWTSI